MSSLARTLSWKQVLHWIERGGWSLADQWIFSGANVIANILLARWLSVSEYGTFAIVFSIFLFTVSLHTALIVEPMLVLGAGRLKMWLRSYLGFLLTSHFVVSIAGMVLLALVSWVFFRQAIGQLPNAILVVSLGLPLLLLPWLSRRAFYLQARSDWATHCSCLYMLTLLALLFLFQSMGRLNLEWAIGAFILASGMTAIPLGFYVINLPKVEEAPSFTSMLATQWAYAKWSGPASVFLWVPVNIFFFALPYSSGGLEATATLKAFGNILNPLSQSNQALIALLLPQLSGAYAAGGSVVLREISRKITIGFLAISGVFWLALAAFRRPILDLLYDGVYTQNADLLLVAGAIPILMGVTAILATELRSAERPKFVFIGYLVGALVAASLGIWLTLAFGLVGALLGQAAAYAGMAIALAWQIRTS